VIVVGLSGGDTTGLPQGFVRGNVSQEPTIRDRLEEKFLTGTIVWGCAL
jgi:hypothetical protein